MYESTLENVKSSFQPLIELAELNRKTLEKMTSVQTSYLTDCISTSIKQVKTLAESGSPQRATQLSFEMIKDFETKLSGATEQNLAALAELRDAYSSLVNGSCTDNYSRIVELCNLKDKFTIAPLETTVAPAAKVAAPAKKATVKKTPAKVAVKKDVAEKAEAKPAVAAKPVVAVKPTVADKPAVAAKKVEEQPKPAVKVAAKAAPKTDAAPAKKAPVKRAAAKPAVKKAAAKPAAKKATAKPAAEEAKPAAKAAPASSAARPVAKAKPASVSSVRAPAAKTH
ncbi:MAG: phasin family protein [Halopseudomonas sp.]